MRRYFITGTNTDCGKTYVTESLLNVLCHAKAIKPVASGCELMQQGLVNADAHALSKACGLDLDVVNPWRFQPPIAPHLAALKAGVHLSAVAIARYCLDLQLPNTRQLFIEGAGGLLVLLNQNETWLDYLLYSKIPVVLVVGMTLGCMNHALLTQSVLQTHHISCVGWVANCIDPHMQALELNIETLIQQLEYPLLGIVPFGEKFFKPTSDLNFIF
jgi:dethiobiotin synthetase